MNYDEQYYSNYAGIGYDHKDFKNLHFNNAIRIKEKLNPKNALDIGCAFGYLVSSLRNFGIEAFGVDSSEYAISKVEGITKCFVEVSNLPDLILPNSFPRNFDLITCIEVLEHLSEEEAVRSVKRMYELTNKRILFSSSPYDSDGDGHSNTQSQSYWVSLFQKHGFSLSEIDVTFVSQWAMLFERC